MFGYECVSNRTNRSEDNLVGNQRLGMTIQSFNSLSSLPTAALPGQPDPVWCLRIPAFAGFSLNLLKSTNASHANLPLNFCFQTKLLVGLICVKKL